MSVGWLSRRFEALAPIGAAMRTDRRRGRSRPDCGSGGGAPAAQRALAVSSGGGVALGRAW